MKPIQTLIVDDEEKARTEVRGLLQGEADIELVGECASGDEAVTALEKHRPDLVFLEAEMPGMSGFEMLETASLTRSPSVIFVTACDQYALKAFDVHAVDYLLKPFTSRRFREALQQARAKIRRENILALQENLSTLIAQLEAQDPSSTETSYLQRVVVKERNHATFLDVEAIDWIEAADNYVRLHTGGQTSLLRTTMNELEDQLDPKHFVRVHRSHIVNVERVKEAHPGGSGDCVLVLEDGTRLKSSRTYGEQRRRALNLVT